jgi:DNA-nicking Smr family endonuclease
MPKRRTPTPRFDPADALLDGRIENTLDLHGCYGSEAESQVRNFVVSSSRRHPGKIVHVITGKGRRSLKGPVLKPLVKRLLQTELSSFVADFAMDLDEAGYLIRLR